MNLSRDDRGTTVVHAAVMFLFDMAVGHCFEVIIGALVVLLACGIVRWLFLLARWSLHFCLAIRSGRRWLHILHRTSRAQHPPW